VKLAHRRAEPAGSDAAPKRGEETRSGREKRGSCASAVQPREFARRGTDGADDAGMLGEKSANRAA
jgi:hypothetical protein